MEVVIFSSMKIYSHFLIPPNKHTNKSKNWFIDSCLQGNQSIPPQCSFILCFRSTEKDIVFEFSAIINSTWSSFYYTVLLIFFFFFNQTSNFSMHVGTGDFVCFYSFKYFDFLKNPVNFTVHVNVHNVHFVNKVLQQVL